MYQKTILIGHLGGNPDTHTFENGTLKATFSVATKKRYKDRNGDQQEVTTWHRCEVYRKLAEIAERYLQRGMLVSIEGEIEHQTYTKDGVERTSSIIQCKDFKILTPKGSTAQSGEPNYNSADADELPF